MRTPENLSHFFFNDTATTELYTLSLHDALPISTPKNKLSKGHYKPSVRKFKKFVKAFARRYRGSVDRFSIWNERSEEHTSELQSQSNLVCRLLLEKKKNKIKSKSIL